MEQLEISGGNKGIVTFDAKVKALMWISTRVMVVLWNQLLGISSKPYSLFVLRMAVSWLKACTKKFKEPNEREMALLETYGQRNPEEVSRIYGLELPLLQEERMAFLKRFFSSQRLISKESSLVIKVRVLRLFYLQKPVPS